MVLEGHVQKIHTRMSYFKAARPKSVTGEGLFEVIEESLKYLGRLIGLETDGASANVANAELKGIFEKN